MTTPRCRRSLSLLLILLTAVIAGPATAWRTERELNAHQASKLQWARKAALAPHKSGDDGLQFPGKKTDYDFVDVVLGRLPKPGRRCYWDNH